MLTKKQINYLLNDPVNLYEKFHHKTKIKKLWGQSDPSKWPDAWKRVYFKSYPRLDKIILPEPTGFAGTELEQVLNKRQSSRKFSKIPLNLDQISNLLYYTAGVKRNKSKEKQYGNRFYPSPGARYSQEVYIISQNSDLPKAVYHYNLLDHSLESLVGLEDYVYSQYFDQAWVGDSSIVVLFTGVFARTTMKYGNRGYRHVLMEAGHLLQNFYLVAAAQDLSICGIGGYVDDGLNSLLDIDGVHETVLNTFAVGNK